MNEYEPWLSDEAAAYWEGRRRAASRRVRTIVMLLLAVAGVWCGLGILALVLGAVILGLKSP